MISKNKKCVFLIGIISILIISTIWTKLKEQRVNDIINIIRIGSENNPTYDQLINQIVLKE